MKAFVGATLVGLAVAGNAPAQQPSVYPRAELPLPTARVAPPPMPTLPSDIKKAPPDAPGAQLQGLGVPAPPVPSLPMPQANEAAKWAPPTAAQLNAPYLDNPIFDPPDPIDPALAAGPVATHCGPRLWLSADYLLWMVKRGPLGQPLVVTGPESDPFAGALDQPGTAVLFGGRGAGFNPFSGARISAGLWAGPGDRIGLEIGGFILEQKSAKFAAGGDPLGHPFLARPFVNALTGAENVYFVSQNFADPTRSALMTGGIDVSDTSRLWGWEINSLFNVSRGDATATNLIAGFRSVGLRERLRINETLRNLAPGGGVSFGGQPVDPPNSVVTYDRFDAENTFYGGQLGARVHLQGNRFGVDLTAKAALGVTQQLVIVDGGTHVVDAGTGKSAGFLPGGVLALPSNMGRHFRNAFSVVPEGNVDFNFAVTDNVIVRAGYSFLYMSSVARPGAQVDRTINPGQVPTDLDYGAPGPASPGFPFRTSGFWAHGINLGLEVRY